MLVPHSICTHSDTPWRQHSGNEMHCSPHCPAGAAVWLPPGLLEPQHHLVPGSSPRLPIASVLMPSERLKQATLPPIFPFQWPLSHLYPFLPLLFVCLQAYPNADGQAVCSLARDGHQPFAFQPARTEPEFISEC